MVQLHRSIQQIHDAGAELHVIGNGAPSFIDGFREQTGYHGPLYTDPSLVTFQAAQLKRGMGRTFDPRGLVQGVKVLKNGFRQGKLQGDKWQQGGVLVIAPGGEILWHHASERPGDNARADKILEALRSPTLA